jgi:nicotinamidase-related amidase
MSADDFSFLADREQSQLIIVDIQTRLVAAMDPAERTRVIRNAGILATAAGLLTVPVIVTQQYPKGLGPTEPAVLDALPPDTPLLDKTCFACGSDEAIHLAIAAAGRPQIILTGMETHVCVLQTALLLHAEGHQVMVVEDAVCSRSPEHRRNALDRLRHLGVTVTNTESVLFEWLRDATHPQFKAVSALIK